MSFEKIFADKTSKSKQKVIALSTWISKNPSSIDELVVFAKSSKDPVKATCIEAIEFATKADSSLATKKCFDFVTASLTETAPRIKWESAKVIGNVASQFPKHLDTVIKNLLINTDHEGTVVRWSAAYALGEIVKLKTANN